MRPKYEGRQRHTAGPRDRYRRLLQEPCTAEKSIIYEHFHNTHPPQDVNARRVRKRQLVSVELWALRTGRRWLVKAVDRAIQRKGLRDA